jgi:hypothetical protein
MESFVLCANCSVRLFVIGLISVFGWLSQQVTQFLDYPCLQKCFGSQSIGLPFERQQFFPIDDSDTDTDTKDLHLGDIFPGACGLEAGVVAYYCRSHISLGPFFYILEPCRSITILLLSGYERRRRIFWIRAWDILRIYYWAISKNAKAQNLRFRECATCEAIYAAALYFLIIRLRLTPIFRSHFVVLSMKY